MKVTTWRRLGCAGATVLALSAAFGADAGDADAFGARKT